MGTTLEYDFLVERLRREREGKRIPDGTYMGPKTALTVSTIPKEALPANLYQDAGPAPPISAPKKRGRKPGSKNKPKVKR